MKTNLLRNLTLSAAALASVSVSEAVNRTLILLQESSDPSSLTDTFKDSAARSAADSMIAQTIGSSETTPFEIRAKGHYQSFVNLSDSACTRANLLNALINETKAGRTVDLAILGHGTTESLQLSGSDRLTGRVLHFYNYWGWTYSYYDNGTIRSLLTEARSREGSSFNFNLRLVYMANHYGATTNDDWLAIGAKTAVGCPMHNFTPEPMISGFWDGFLESDKRVRQSSDDSHALAQYTFASVPSYQLRQSNGLTMLQETQQEVAGDGNLIFRDECQLEVGESRWIYVHANQTHNFGNVYLEAGASYSFSVGASSYFGVLGSTWSNGSITTNANGHAPSNSTEYYYRRYSGNIMALMGERCSHPDSNPRSLIAGSGFTIGTSNTITAPGHGFLNLFANDWVYRNLYNGYGNNAGTLWVKITRNPDPATTSTSLSSTTFTISGF